MRWRPLILIAVLALQGCVSSGAAQPAQPGTYLWLPTLGISDQTRAVRDRLDAQLQAAGYTPAANAALALALSTDAAQPDDGSLGLGVYAGGYAYFPSERAPPGYVQLIAYDTRTHDAVWRVQWRANAAVIPNIDLARGGGLP